MDMKTVDLCVVQEYRLTEYRVFKDGNIVDTYFNIRDGNNVVQGRDYGDIKIPLDIMLNMCAA